MLNLPDVTLVMVETLCHDLARLSVKDCMAKAKFGEVLVCTDMDLEITGTTWVQVENWPSKLGWSEYLWYGVPQHVKTKQALLIQWDSGICQPEKWRDEFMDYDHIGAPWWWHPTGMDVGNTGFSLRSKRLMDFLVQHKDAFPVSDPEDVALSQHYRADLEKAGFKWPDYDTADLFAFECSAPSVTQGHFGYHAMRNWPMVFDKQELLKRAKLAASNRYIRETSMFQDLLRASPRLRSQL